jgi:streptogramin lyase
MNSTHALRATGAALALLPALWSPGAHAVALSGQVTAAGKPAAGAMVSVFSADKLRRETVYTDAEGRYAISTPFAGKLDVRARLTGWADARQTLQASAQQRIELALALAPFASPTDSTAALPASAHNARLPWASEAERAPFVSQCNYCHQMGNSTTRAPRSHDAWLGTIGRMEGYLAMVTRGEADTIAGVLERGFDGKAFEARHANLATPELARAKVQEWLIGDNLSFIHDMDVASDGKFYGTDEGHDVLWVLDPKTGQIEKIPLPAIDLPRGGLFAGMNLHIGIFTGKHGPHSLAEDKQGRLWMTNALSSTLMSFDLKTRAFKTYPVPKDALYPHTIRVDADDNVWFTIVASNQVARFEPKTETMTVLSLPSNGLFRWVTDMLFPTLLRVASWFPEKNVLLDFSHHKFLGYNVLAFPYGIDIHPKDGSVWYAKLYAHKIGRIDPKTLQISEYDTPMKGPRRPRFGADGVLWIPSFDDGGLMSFDTATTKFESMKLPGLAAGEYETPYALNVDRKGSGDVWLTANNADRVLRYSPKTKAFTSYASPMRVTFLRDMSFTADGKVCSSQSNLPAWAMEDGVPSYLCIDPTGGERDRLALAKP